MIVVASFAIALVGLALAFGFQGNPSPESIDIVSLTEDIRAGKVETIVEDRNGRAATIEYKDAATPDRMVELPSGAFMADILTTAEVPFQSWPAITVEQQSALSQASPVLKIGVVILIMVGAFWFIRRSQAGFGRNSSRRGAFDPIRPGDRTAVLLTDVAGSEEVKEELADVIDFLRDSERYHKLGARIPRGVMMAGPPGTGKTLLARAVAGEARASFFSVSGSEFVELYVGVGASRVRELFKRARECAPAIIFIDEIDAVGRKRGKAEHSSEYDQTLNQILVEMDGFDQRSTVVVMAATNRIDILDSALLRPGRFDRKVHVDLPDRAARAAILRVHSRGKPLAADVDLDLIASRTTGMSGADLANLMNEAAILSARRHATIIEMDTLTEAIDRTLAGPARRNKRFSDRERETIAYHEAGHALVAHYLPQGDPVSKVTIVSRGQAGGFTMFVPEEDRGLWTRQQLTDRLASMLGGYAAEEIIFGEVTTGSSNDLERSSAMTLSMVSRYGMGQAFGLLSSGDDGQFSFSQRTTYAAESEARDLVNTARDIARQILIEHRAELDTLAERLLEVETVEAAELIEMLGPAVTAGPRKKRPVAPVPLVPVSAVRPAGRPTRRRPIERLIAIPAAIITSTKPARRKRVIDTAN
jgi:cell division protease FtsH